MWFPSRLLPGAAVLACVALAQTIAFAQPVERIARAFPASPVRPIDIRIAAGSVDIRGEDRPDISIEIERPGGDLAREVIDESQERILVEATRPETASAQAPVKVVVRAPRATPIHFVHVGVGDVSLAGWRGTVQVKVEDGAIVADDVSGIVRLETGSGDITLRRATLSPDGLLRCRTLTGNITVGLSEVPADGRILLMTMTGTVRSDLPVADKEGFGGRLKEGTMGNGQPLLSLDTVRGDVTVTVGR